MSQAETFEDYPLDPVPRDRRKGFLSLAVVLVGFTFYSGTLFGGGAVGSAFRFWPDMILVLLAGNLILASYAAALGYIAYSSGLSTVLMARFGFGEHGSKLVDLIFAFTQIGWYAWGTALIAKLLNTLLGMPESYNWLAMLFFTFAFCSTAYVGYRGLDWLSRFAVPSMVILMIWSISIGWSEANGFSGLQSRAPRDDLGIGAAITIIVGTFISGGTQSPNWTRFAPTARAAVWGALAAFLVGNGLLSFCGAFGATAYENHDIVEVMAMQGLKVWAIVLLFLNMWTTQDNTIYNFSVAGANLFRSSKRTMFVVAGACVALVLSLAGIYDFLIPYMILLGTFIPPIGGVIMADFWYRHRGCFPALESTTTAFNWCGLLAYVVASAIAYYAPGIAPVNGIVAAALIYVLISKFTSSTIAERPAST